MAKATSNTELDRAMKRVEQVLTDRYQNASGIKREGNVIILPEKGSLEDHIETLTNYKDSLEEVMNTEVVLDAHPDDALYALYKVIEDKFGALMSTMTFSFFGARPGEQRTIRISATETMVVPVGRAEIFGSLPITLWVEPEFDRTNDVGGYVKVTFQHPRKWEPFIKDIEVAILQWIKTKSIFRQKAINSDFSFMDIRYFDPKRKVVYSDLERTKLGGEVFAPIVATEQWRKNGRGLKRGVLLYGDYGTGKSLTLLYIAKLCEKHGWTFINVKPGDDIARVLRFARRYQPAVVAVEDIDRDTGVQRTDRVNTIINQFDGVVTKHDEVMVVMTTNHKDDIQPAMLRPGRIDTSIEVGVLDPHSTAMVIMNELKDDKGNNMLEGKLDEELVFKHAEGYTKAYLVEAVQRATGYALMRRYEEVGGDFQGDGHVKIVQADIIGGLDGLRDQWNLMRKEREVAAPKIDNVINDIVGEQIKDVKDNMNLLVKKVGLK